jgi:hypothetical protein
MIATRYAAQHSQRLAARAAEAITLLRLCVDSCRAPRYTAQAGSIESVPIRGGALRRRGADQHLGNFGAEVLISTSAILLVHAY